jgi:hypothetical protein
MDPRERNAELELTRLAREGRTDRRNPAGGEHLMRLPWEDLKALEPFFPGILSRDPIEQSRALDRLFASPLAEKYRVSRTPAQVRRAPRPPIIVR